ncbi:hypothetical protein EOM82_06265 [bacterium]|nr:hypothetical protein [bacterium]
MKKTICLFLLTAILFCSSCSSSNRTEITKTATVGYGFSSRPVIIFNKHKINELYDIYKAIGTEKTDTPLNYSEAFHICMGEISYWIDENGTVMFDNNTDNIIKTKDVSGYESIKTIYNYYRFGDGFPFKKPPFTLASCDNDWYKYVNVNHSQLQDYINSLVQEGYQLEGTGRNYLLYKDDIFINISDWTENDGRFSMCFYEGIKHREGTLTKEQAKSLINNDEIGYLIEWFIPGLYEKTGAQVFISSFEKGDERSGYHFNNVIFLVTSEEARSLNWGYNEYSVTDLDGDGKYELLYLMYGFTSGLFTFTTAAYSFEENKITQKYFGVASPREFYDMKLLSLGEGKAGLITKTQGYIPTYKLFSVSIYDGIILFIDDEGNGISDIFQRID